MNKLSIDSKKVSDTGQALVLLCLVIFLFTSSRIFLTLALILLVINMVCPVVVKPAALVWFGLAEVLGFVVSRIVLTVVFVLLVLPVGFVRYLMGCDPFQLKKWKKSSSPAQIKCQNRGGGQNIMTQFLLNVTIVTPVRILLTLTKIIERKEGMSFLRDLYGFFMTRKKYWLTPIIIVLLLLGLLIVFGSGSALAPFIYTIF
ncbi:MAG: DUF5989 family protein [Planctomycetaceae bacterium]|jgi:hypothetical protein|nr:DUF5989 family protein [Planctomycetaceae bacterium]